MLQLVVILNKDKTMRIDIRGRNFPKIKLQSQPCDWTDKKITNREQAFVEATQTWSDLQKKYDSEILQEPRFERQTKVQVQVVKKLVRCVYEEGQILEVVAEYWDKKWQNLEIGQEINAGFYLGKILEVETARVQSGNRRLLPDWKLPDPPTKEPSPSLHDAIKQCHKMIRSVCPHAHWEGFWNERPKILGFLDSKKEKTLEKYAGCTVYLEKGTQYLVELCEETQSLILSKQRIERYFYYYEVTSVGEVGGSWSDKGYY
jgi:hypothetical protein